MDVILIVALVSLMIGLSKGGFGGPVPISLVTPLLSQVMPAYQAVGVALPLLIFADMFALWIYRGSWDLQRVKMMLPMAIAGILVGTLLLTELAVTGQDLTLRRLLGLFTLVVVSYKFISERLRTVEYHPQKWHGYFVGWASGFGSALANVGSPPFTAYMLLQRVEPKMFIGTTTLFFAIINLLKLPGYLYRPEVLDINRVVSILWAAPLIPLGVWLGKKFINHVNPKFFENFMLALLFLVSLVLLFSSPN